MSNARYVSGARLERKVRDRLLEVGYHTVVRSAGSKGWADVAAFGPEQNLLIQVKGGKMSKPAIRRVLSDAPRPLCQDTYAELWIYEDGGWTRILAV